MSLLEAISPTTKELLAGSERPFPKLTFAEYSMLDDGICPDCTGHHFLEGPHGGMNVNIKCAGCGAKFNIVPGLEGSFGKERIGWPEKSQSK